MPKKLFLTYTIDGSRLGAFPTRLDVLLSSASSGRAEKPIQHDSIKPIPWKSIPRVIFRLAPSRKAVWAHLRSVPTTFVLVPARPGLKCPSKMAAPPNRYPRNRSQGSFPDLPHRMKSFARVCDALGRPSFSCSLAPA